MPTAWSGSSGSGRSASTPTTRSSGFGTTRAIRRIADAFERDHDRKALLVMVTGAGKTRAVIALAGFLAGKTLAANQIEFVNLIVDHLTEYGAMDAAMFYESPFTDLPPRGPDGLFSSAAVDQLIAAINGIRDNAIAA